jgi:hypothetical protein
MLTLSKPHPAAPIRQDQRPAPLESLAVAAAADASDRDVLACAWVVDPATGAVRPQWTTRVRR